MDFSQGILQSCREEVTLFAFFLLNCCWDFCSTARANSSRRTWKYHSTNAISSKYLPAPQPLLPPCPPTTPSQQWQPSASSFLISLSIPKIAAAPFPEHSGPSPPAVPSPCAPPAGQHLALEAVVPDASLGSIFHSNQLLWIAQALPQHEILLQFCRQIIKSRAQERRCSCAATSPRLLRIFPPCQGSWDRSTELWSQGSSDHGVSSIGMAPKSGRCCSSPPTAAGEVHLSTVQNIPKSIFSFSQGSLCHLPAAEWKQQDARKGY